MGSDEENGDVPDTPAFRRLANTPAGQVMFVHGNATIERGDERIPAERGIDFYAGDTFHTEAASTLQLRFTDGGTQAVRPDSSFTLDRYELASDEPVPVRRNRHAGNG